MMKPGITAEHCRVAPVDGTSDAVALLQYHRHLFAYAEAARRMPPNARVLEVGCGEGYGASHLSAITGASTLTPVLQGPLAQRATGSAGSEVRPEHNRRAEGRSRPGGLLVGLDISLDLLGHAARRYPAIRFCCAFGAALPFPAQAFDVVLSFQVIEHVPDVPAYLSEIRRVLADGGCLMLTTPNRSLRLLPLQKPWNPYHLREYSAAGLRRTVRRCFPDVELRGIAASPAVFAIERARVRQDPLRVYGGLARRALRRVPPAQPAARAASGAEMGATGAAPDRRLDITLDDFFLAGPAEGMDLFAVARR